MPTTTININEAGYDLDVGGTTGSIVSGTLLLYSQFSVNPLFTAIYDGNGITCRYSNFTIANEWAAIIINGLTGVSISSNGGLTTVGGAVKQGIASGAIDPTTSDYASGTGGWWKNTGANEIRFWYNDGGVMKKSGALT